MKTTREIEKKMNENTFWFSVIVSTLISGTILFVCFSIHNQTVYVDLCNIGEDKLAGDFSISSENYYDVRDCAIRDCNAFNNYQIKNNQTIRCLV